MSDSPGEVTSLLAALQSGDDAAGGELLEVVYEELKRIARSKMAGERGGHTLQPTALAHDAFVKLVGQQRVQWQSRAHFLSVAALAMRRILINHAKGRIAQKRGGHAALATFDDQVLGQDMKASELVALDDALVELAKQDERQSKVVEYKFFGGLTYEEIAEVLGISVPTVRRDWRFARAWLGRELSRDR